MENKAFAYIKVDTQTDDIDLKVTAIKKYCLKKDILLSDENIFVDKCIDRKQIKMDSPQALKNLSLNSGDIFITIELDQLGSTIEDIKNVWEALYIQGIDLVVIENEILSTFGKSLLEKKLKSDIIIELLSYLSSNLDTINKETKQIYNKTNKGNSIGRPKEDIDTLSDEQSKLLIENFDKFNRTRSERTITAEQFMNILGLKRNTFYKIIKQYKETLSQ